MRSSNRAGILAVALAVSAMAIAGCTASPPVRSPTPAGSPTPAPAAGPLGCDELAPPDVVAQAMTGADGVTPQPLPAVQASGAMTALELAAAGGLNCSWRTGPTPQGEQDGAGELVYLTLRVLPGAASQYQPVWAGDAPSTDTLDVGGITASTAIGEAGWQLSAPVGDSWVELRLSPHGLGWVGSPFDGLAPAAVLDQLASVAAVAFPQIADASPEQLSWPRAASQRQGDAVCNGGLDPQGIGMALQAASIEAEAYDPTTEPPRSFGDAVASAARAMVCDYTVDGTPGPHITFVVGAGEQFDVLKQADLATTFEPIDLSGLPGSAAGDEALRAKVDDGPASPVYLRVGDSVYEIEGRDGAAAVAEAILAQLR
jgi:hypothetical protein